MKRNRKQRMIKNATIIFFVCTLLGGGGYYAFNLFFAKEESVPQPIQTNVQAPEPLIYNHDPMEDYRLNLATILKRETKEFSDSDIKKKEALVPLIESNIENSDIYDVEENINALAYLYDKQHTKSQNLKMKYVKGILVANKRFCMPTDFSPEESTIARSQFELMAEVARKENLELTAFSTYRDAEKQEELFSRYVATHGMSEAERFSSRPGCSDHQTGLAFDIGGSDESKWAETTFDETPEAKWLDEHAADYGFLLRYPQGKEQQTGYMYESWHYRYVGDIAGKIKDSGLSLEEYLEVPAH